MDDLGENMIKGPWPLSHDKTRRIVPLEGPHLTPMFQGERVALRVSEDDKGKLRRGGGNYGVITDLDTGRQYRLIGIACSFPGCLCDAKIEEVSDGG